MAFHIHLSQKTIAGEHLVCFWELSGGHQYTEYILPKGVIEIIFNLSEPIKAKLPNHSTFIQVPQCFIQGIHSQAVTANYSGSHHLFGIRLKPSAVKGFLTIIPSELRNQSIDVTLIEPQFRELWNQLGEATSFQERVAVVESSFRYDSVVGCPRSTAICDFFLSGHLAPFQSVDLLARKVGYSSRQLNRKSHEFFGLSAEELVLYKKFMYAVNLMHHKPSKLVDIALESGFYDQPHFNKVFKSFTSLTPKEYRRQKTDLPFHLFL